MFRRDERRTSPDEPKSASEDAPPSDASPPCHSRRGRSSGSDQGPRDQARRGREGEEGQLGSLLRSAADLENTRKRQKRELEDAKFETKNKVLKEMLPVVDNLERAIEHAAGAGGEKNPRVEGVQLVLRQFTTAFERLEVTRSMRWASRSIRTCTKRSRQQESDQPAGTVVQVLQRATRPAIGCRARTGRRSEGEGTA